MRPACGAWKWQFVEIRRNFMEFGASFTAEALFEKIEGEATMRGADVTQGSMFSYLTLWEYAPEAHPLRPICEIVNAALREMDETFAAMYADSGRDSTPLEQLLRGLILQSLYGLRSERLLCEQLGYNMLFRWLVGPGLDKGP